VKALRDQSPAVRLMVVQTLPRCGKEAIDPLLSALGDADAQVRAYAIAGLAPLEPETKAVLPALEKQVKEDPDPLVRQSALRTLGRLGPATVPVLVAGLKDKEPTVQNAALKALGQVGPGAKAAVPDLKALAREASNPAVRRGAVGALEHIGPEAMPAVVDLLGTGDSATRLACLQCLGRQEGPPRSAVKNATLALTDADSAVRLLAAHVLGQIGPGAKEAAEALEKAKEDKDPAVRAAAAKALEKVQGK
jgi:HEAT repeat protein